MEIRGMRPGDLDADCSLDAEPFGADRRFFLERRFRTYPEAAFVAEAGGVKRAARTKRAARRAAASLASSWAAVGPRSFRLGHGS